MRKQFLRRNTWKHKRLGSNRRKLMKWRRPKGIHNKMRERRKGYSSRPEIGMRSKGQKMRYLVHNLLELQKIPEKSEAILAHIGRKKRILLIEEAEKREIRILNKGSVPYQPSKGNGKDKDFPYQPSKGNGKDKDLSGGVNKK